jgi:hypothetical protein
MAAGVVHIPWYATVFRGDRLAEALAEIAPLALRYGATDYAVHRSRDDRYKFIQMSTFESKLDFERYWHGEEFAQWRTDRTGWHHVPVVYVWHDVILSGGLERVGGVAGEGDTS